MNKTERLEMYCQNDYVDAPEFCEVIITPQLMNRIHNLHQAVILADADTISTYWGDGLTFGDDNDDGDLINQDKFDHLQGHSLFVSKDGWWFEFYGKWGGERYWSDSLPVEGLDIEFESTRQTEKLSLASILAALQYAKADIEDLIEVAGTNPTDEADMLADNYASQWRTLQLLTGTIGQLENLVPAVQH